MPPEACWRRSFDDLPDPRHFKAAMPSFRESLSLLPLAWRMGQYVSEERKGGRDPIFDLNGLMLQPPSPGPYAGVPLGGLGGGCIGRGFRGDFRRWNLSPGKYQHGTVAADQFSVRVSRAGQLPEARVLSAEDGSGSEGLKGWGWGMDPKTATYHALYPRAWTVYEEAVPLIRLVCRQMSPVLPNDYGESSLPVGVFEWSIENLGASTAEVSVMFSFQNGTGMENDKAGGHYNRRFHVFGNEDGEEEGREAATASVVGVHLHHQQGGIRSEDSLTFAVAADVRPDVELSMCTQFVSSGGGRGGDGAAELWRQFVNTGRVGEVRGGGGGGGGGGGRGEGGGGGKSATASAAGVGFKEAERERVLKTRIWGNDRIVEMTCEGTGDEKKHKKPERKEENDNNGNESKSPTTITTTTSSSSSSKSVRHHYRHSHKNGDRQHNHHHHNPSRPNESIAAAVCQKVILPPHRTTQISFALAWDMPIVRFGGGLALPRRYTRFFGKEGGLTAGLLASHALKNYGKWEKAIEAWQTPVLEDSTLPDFYKHMLFNELYFLTDGGTVWTESVGGVRIEGGREEEREEGMEKGREAFRACDGEQGLVGQFLYLEGHEYLMYNTYDVHFYASFALVMLWPMLELSVQRDVAAAVIRSDPGMRRLLARAEIRPRKISGAVPHDLGCPSGTPWEDVNAYNLQDVNRWKDLGPKLVLQIHRDYVATGSLPFVMTLWPVLRLVMEAALAAFDLDGDGLIENSGFPDQTYDIWTVEGPSAYTGGLWVAALTAMAALGEIVEKEGRTEEGREERVEMVGGSVSHYAALATQARGAYVRHLWNGTYFDYDNSWSAHQDSIMADQMAGQWYARACGLTPVVVGLQARSSLTTVFDFNVRKFADGYSGAVNGMRPDGQVDETCMQSQEVWTGTTYSVAAAMLQEARWAALEAERRPDGRGRALKEEAEFLRHAAFETARGLYEGGWKRFGYWFATPEAWDSKGHFRSLGYMRPLCVWAMQWALTRMPTDNTRANASDAGSSVVEGVGGAESIETAMAAGSLPNEDYGDGGRKGGRVGIFSGSGGDEGNGKKKKGNGEK
ncbi:non-lysosomal glucosylceramidase [Nannochloropsis oceanica]